MHRTPVSRESILGQLQRITSSSIFENAVRSRAMLEFVVHESLDERAGSLKEYTIGAAALGRGESFDPRTDPIVRAEASRLRDRLERYYAAEGNGDPVMISLPKGSYAPQFLDRRVVLDLAEAPARNVRPIRSTRFTWLLIGALGAACLAGIGMWASGRFSRPATASLLQFDIELKTRGAVGSEVGPDVVLSPDGARIVYVSLNPEGISHLNARLLNQSEPTELGGTEGARMPFFSPDGGWVGFWSGFKLLKTPVDGGSPVVLCDTAELMGASWGEDGNIIAASADNRLLRIASAGGNPVVITDFSAEHIHPIWPQVLPGANTVLFTALGPAGPNAASIEVLTVSTGKRTVIVRGGTYARYLPNGYLTYVNQGTLFGMTFDLKRMVTEGAPVRILEGIAYSFAFGFAQLDFSRTGAMVYRKNTGGQAEWLDASGKTEPLLTKPGQYLWPRLSPDGKNLTYSVTEGGVSTVWIYNLQQRRATRVVTGGLYLPLWTPDGRKLILGGDGGLAWVRTDDPGKPEPLVRSNSIQVPSSFSPDGKRLAYHERSATGFDLWTVPVESSSGVLKAGKPEPFLQSPAYETYPAFSPDGHFLAYGSNESNSWEVYVRSFPDNGTKVKVSTDGGRIPRWSPNGQELFYRTDDQRIMLATYKITGEHFAVSAVHQWTPTRLWETGVLSNFDLSPDGKRIVALVPAGEPEDRQTENHVTFMLNFSDEVQRRILVAKR